MIIIWCLLGMFVASLFLAQQECRIDGFDIMVALLIMAGWPVYLLGRLIMRLYNGDWR